jgi:putative tricarboxylic transport membrane protein
MEVKDLYLGIISLAVGTVFLIFSLQLDVMPAAFPMIISIMLQVLGLMKIGTVTVGLVRQKGLRVEFLSEMKNVAWRKEMRIVFPLVMAILYAFLFKPLGFIILTPVLVFSIAYYFGYRKIVRLIIISLGFSVFLYLLFGLFLNVPIPLFPRGF